MSYYGIEGDLIVAMGGAFPGEHFRHIYRVVKIDDDDGSTIEVAGTFDSPNSDRNYNQAAELYVQLCHRAEVE